MLRQHIPNSAYLHEAVLCYELYRDGKPNVMGASRPKLKYQYQVFCCGR